MRRYLQYEREMQEDDGVAARRERQLTDDALLPVYRRMPVRVSYGAGSRLFDENGKSYLDFGTGIAVNALGHCHVRLNERLFAQADRIWHCSNKFEIPVQASCARRLTEISYADRVFFCNSGAEANEGGLKIMRRWQAACGRPERWRTIVFGGAFHGRTLATLAATDRDDYRVGFGHTVDGFDRVKQNDLAAIEAAISSATAGVLLEPIQGDGGIRVFDKNFVKELRVLTAERGLLLMFDEIQSGVGRTGTFLASEQFEVEPDITSLAKGLGGGFPIGAVLTTEDAAKGMDFGSHGTTFGGNPLGCAVADSVIEEIMKPGFLASVRENGVYLADRLDALIRRFPSVLREARGMGLMLGIQTVGSNTAFELACVEQGLVVLCAADNVVRLLPPLTVTKAEIIEALQILEHVSSQFRKQ